MRAIATDHDNTPSKYLSVDLRRSDILPGVCYTVCRKLAPKFGKDVRKGIGPEGIEHVVNHDGSVFPFDEGIAHFVVLQRLRLDDGRHEVFAIQIPCGGVDIAHSSSVDCFHWRHSAKGRAFGRRCLLSLERILYSVVENAVKRERLVRENGKVEFLSTVAEKRRETDVIVVGNFYQLSRSSDIGA